jgi:hypothetical protein
MSFRCEFNLNGGRRRLVMAQGSQEPFDHVALRLAAYALFWGWEPKIEVSPKHPALASVEFRPDFIAFDEGGGVKLWGECGNVTLNKLDKVARRFPRARIAALKASETEGRKLRSDLKDSVDRQERVEILAFRPEDFAVWRNAVVESTEVFGESTDRSLNLVINHTPLACDLAVF